MKVTVHSLLLVFVLAACTQTEQPGAAIDTSEPGAEAGSAAEPLAEAELSPREALVKENIEFHLRNRLGGRAIIMGPVGDSELAGWDRGTFTVGRDTYHFLVSESDETILFLADEPYEVYDADHIAGVLQEEAEELARLEAEARAQLAAEIEAAPKRGNPDAPITIVEFSDFECPFCKRGFDTMEQVMEKYGNEVRFVYLHYPLSFHPWAQPSAVAAVCTADQDHDAFWKLHDHFFKTQDQIEADNVIDRSRAFVSDLGLNVDEWSECAENKDSDTYREALATVNKQLELGSSLGVTGTPGFFINGTFLSGAQPIERFDELIEQARQAAM